MTVPLRARRAERMGAAGARGATNSAEKDEEEVVIVPLRERLVNGSTSADDREETMSDALIVPRRCLPVIGRLGEVEPRERVRGRSAFFWSGNRFKA